MRRSYTCGTRYAVCASLLLALSLSESAHHWMHWNRRPAMTHTQTLQDLRSGSQRIGVLELNAMRINPATGKFITCASVSPLSRSPLHSASQDSAHTYTARDVMHIPAGARTSAFGKSFSGADGEAGHANEEESWRDPNAVRLRSLENSAADDCESVGGGGSERRRRRGRLQQRYMPPANE